MQNPAPSHAPRPSTQQIRDDLDQSRRRGPLQQIQIPPCPELLAQLQQAMSQPEPDLNLVARIASSDVRSSRIAKQPRMLRSMMKKLM